MRSEQVGKSAANLVDDLKQQRTSEAVLEIGGDEATDVAEVVPDGAFEQIASQRGERRRGEQLIEPHRAAPALAKVLRQGVPVRPLADGVARDFRRAGNVDRGVVVL